MLTSANRVDQVIAVTHGLPGVRGSLQTGALGGQAVVDVIPERETNSGTGAALIDDIRHATQGLGVRIGGSGAVAAPPDKMIKVQVAADAKE